MKLLFILTVATFFLIETVVKAQTKKENKFKTFKLVDTSSDGVLSQDEMIGYYLDKTDTDGERIYGVVLFSTLDTDKNGVVSLKEFSGSSAVKKNKTKLNPTLSLKKVNPKNPNYKEINSRKLNSNQVKIKQNQNQKTKSQFKQKRKEVFRRIDVNNNKIIVLSEMVKFYKHKKNKKGQPIDSRIMFYGLDTNKDKKLTLNEYVKKVDWGLGKLQVKLIDHMSN